MRQGEGSATRRAPLDQLEQGYEDGFEGYSDEPLYDEDGEAVPEDGEDLFTDDAQGGSGDDLG